MSNVIHLKRKDIFQTKGQLINLPFFDANELPEHQIKRLNSALAEIIMDTDTNEGDSNENT